MNSYLSIVPKYLSAHKKRTRLVITSVVIAVALVTGIFSMLDVFLEFQKVQVIQDFGNYHIVVKEVTEEEIQIIGSRVDVQNAGRWIDLEEGTINGVKCLLGAIDPNFAENMNIKLIKGKYPTEKNELMLENWAMEKLKGLKIKDKVKIALKNGITREFVISGVYKDLSNTKGAGVPGILLSINGAKELVPGIKMDYVVLFKDGVNIIKAEAEIKEALSIKDDRIARNERLLALIGQSTNSFVIGIYITGCILFCIVLIAGFLMIYNTFNISVMERVRQFGLLRCIGASQKQIKKMVIQEGLIIVLRAIPIGLTIGMFITFLCCAVLKFYNSSIFGEIPLFNISFLGIVAGVLDGFLTVFLASYVPAKKASKASPVNAVTEISEIRISKNKKHGYLTKILPAEIAMGINNAVLKKKTLFLMSSSIAISIVMFLGFQVFIDFVHSSLKTTKPYTPDISIVSEQGLDSSLYENISELSGVNKVSRRMFSYVYATFDASRLTPAYKDIVGKIETTENGLFIPPEKSWLISYDKNQLQWAKEDLIKGELSEEKLNKHNGIVAVAETLRNGIGIKTTNLQLGDKVYIQTPDGAKEMTVMGILRTVPFSSSEPTMTTFITTEKMYTQLTRDSTIKVIDIKLKNQGQEKTVNEIKEILDDSVSFYDLRQKNAEINRHFITMAVFVYGFVVVIALISALNIINTMNTSVEAKTRYLGVMRAIGMTGVQLEKMVLVEALTYSMTGYIAGCIMGIALQKIIIHNFLTKLLDIWKFPFIQIVLILIVLLLITFISIISPLRRIKAKGISEIIRTL
ncbi:ABC transporter permease [Thermosediminibacter litoriperuensis]|uniref:Putative ABC transport system permease protein n=1 Tax=Thermosediminibacter litoriperuensis TaxID=291989 RepID=A0A5S5AQA2_9FIRM|nr:FtsX-like permease family protein [Thermosediminibacter litoriperuensis]TYP54213.1 putative ABC transport system permease protein [Thermosediminibacter litoriperuensis]